MKACSRRSTSSFLFRRESSLHSLAVSPRSLNCLGNYSSSRFAINEHPFVRRCNLHSISYPTHTAYAFPARNRTFIFPSQCRDRGQKRNALSLTPADNIPLGQTDEAELALIQEGRKLQFAGDYDGAMEKYNEVLHSNSNSAGAWWMKGHLQFKLKKYTEALKCYEEVVRCKPHIPEPFVDMALCHIGMSDNARATQLLSDAIFLDPKLKDAYVYRGDIYLFDDRLDKAFEDYSMVISLEGKNVTAWAGIGKVELQRGKLLNSRTALQYAIQYAEAEYFATKRTKDVVLRDEEDAHGQMKSATRNLVDAYSMMGVLEQQSSNYEQAKEWLTKGLKLFFGDDHSKPGKKTWNNVFDLRNDAADLYMKRAYIFMLTEDHRLCLQDADAGLALNSDHHLIRFIRGQAYYALGAYSEAERDLAIWLEADRKTYTSPPQEVKEQYIEIERMIQNCRTRMGV